MDANARYRSAGLIATILCILLVGNLLLSLAGAGSGWMEVELLKSAAAGQEITEDAAVANDMRQGMIGLAQLGVYIITVVFFCIWIFRANQNARALGAENMSYTPGWSVGWFFIPFMNLFKPYCAMNEIWKASDPESDPIMWDRSKTSPIIGTWWGLWILSGVFGQVAMRASFTAQDIDAMLVGSWAQVGSDIIGVPLALVAIMMINGLQGRQNLKHVKRQQETPQDLPGGPVAPEERPQWMFTEAA